MQCFERTFNVGRGFADTMVGLALAFFFGVTLFIMIATTPCCALGTGDVELKRVPAEIAAKNPLLERIKREIGRPAQLVHGQMEAEAKLKEELTSRDIQLELAVEEIMAGYDLLAAKDASLSVQRKELETAREEIEKKKGLLQEREQRLKGLGLKLSRTEEDLVRVKDELFNKQKSLLDVRARLEALHNRVTSLNDKIAGYVDEIGRLNKLLSESKKSETREKTRAVALQKETSTLKVKLNELSAKQARTGVDPQKKMRLSQLMDILGQKDQEIEILRKLTGYRGEFLAKIKEAFTAVPNIKVQGDRLVFQSEILFAPGRAEINESGKKELERFSSVYKEIVPKIPKGDNLIILVQGHTDITPVKSTKYRSNWELSADRAMQVVRYLMEKGIPAKRLGATALGEFHPVAKGDSSEAKRLNRRIEIKITSL
jgi:chemotaxis protein MotB